MTLQNLFNECRMMRGTAPSWLWDTSDPRYTAITTPGGMFSACFMLSNYADIPATYGGGVKF